MNINRVYFKGPVLRGHGEGNILTIRISNNTRMDISKNEVLVPNNFPRTTLKYVYFPCIIIGKRFPSFCPDTDTTQLCYPIHDVDVHVHQRNHTYRQNV